MSRTVAFATLGCRLNQVDTQQLKEMWDERRPITDPTVGGFPYSWTTLYWVNPYFKAFGHRNEDERDRLIGQVSATYELTPWLSAMVRTGTASSPNHSPRALRSAIRFPSSPQPFT